MELDLGQMRERLLAMQAELRDVAATGDAAAATARNSGCLTSFPVPEGTFTTAGNKGLFVTVVPGHDLVIVRTGVNPSGVRWQQQEFVAAVMEMIMR